MVPTANLARTEPILPPDEELIGAARRGERSARNSLLLRYAPSVNSLAFHLLGNDEELDDVVQECFVQALASLGSLRDALAFESWLRLIVVRTAARLIRRRQIARRLGWAAARPRPSTPTSIGSARGVSTPTPWSSSGASTAS